jgi:hypothetical protein
VTVAMIIVAARAADNLMKPLLETKPQKFC